MLFKFNNYILRQLNFDLRYKKKILFYTSLYKIKYFKHIARFLYYFIRFKISSDIPPSVQFKGTVIIPHLIGIVIGSTAVIGNNVTIFPNVVIGAKYSPKSPNPLIRHAIIGENTILGANSSIIGNIVIGNNVIISAGSVITKDVPDNVIAFGVNKIRIKT